MKKLLYVGAMAMALCASSCNGGDADNNGLDTVYRAEKVDSLIKAFSTVAGYQINQEFSRGYSMDSTLDKKEVMRGVQYAFAADTTTSYLYGMHIGQGLLNQAKMYHQMGMDFDDKMLLDEFKVAFMKDGESIDIMELNDADATFRRLDAEMREAREQYLLQVIEQSEESQANIKAGKAYVDSLVKADPSVKVLPSGVAIKVKEAGEGDKLQKTDRVRMIYQGRTLDGKVFDQLMGDPENIRETVVSSRPNGLIEALTQLTPGTKATIVVPGKEAFGVKNMRRFSLGPNEPVVYEVEIFDVTTPQAAPVAGY